MNNYRDIIISILRRGLLAIAVGAVGWWLLATASGGWVATPRLLLGMACLVGASIIIAFPVARLIAELSGNLFYPDRRFSHPKSVYIVPQSKRAEGLYEEAIAGFEKIAEEFPSEVKPYIEMIDISIVNLEDPERANRIYQRGISLLKKDEDKDVLAKMYSEIRPRLNAKPSN